MDWGALNDFKQLAVHDIDRSTLESAIRNDYIQMVNQSAKSGPYEITINAVTADENKLILLYTGTSDSSQEIAGAILMTRLCSEMLYNPYKRGLATLGIGGGMGIATLVEAVK